MLLVVSPGESLGDTGDRAGPAVGDRTLPLHSEVLTWVKGELWGPVGVWFAVPEYCDEERDKHGDVVAPVTLECSGVCRPMADRMLFPLIPLDSGRMK